MKFWEFGRFDEQTALIEDSGRSCTYRQLGQLADNIAEQLNGFPDRTMGLLFFDPSIDTIATYLGTLRSKQHVALLFDPKASAALAEKLITVYQPEWVATRDESIALPGYANSFSIGGLSLFIQKAVGKAATSKIHADLGLLLSTSGSTGSQKLVRLSYNAIANNAESICTYLNLGAHDQAVTTLSPAYSFGLSIINSHLLVGGSLLLTEHTLLSREFWNLIEDSEVTSLSGVPSHYDMLRRAGLQKRRLPKLRMLTQAGGKLAEKRKTEFHELARKVGIEFFVMYGQTEAAPRISYVPPKKLGVKLNSIGIPVPGGHLEVDASSNELIYEGQNVMLGYAESRTDLGLGDVNKGVLRTGDVGYQDDEGYFFLSGRLQRFIKLSGARTSLDDVESAVVDEFDVICACIGEDEKISLVLSGGESPNDGTLKDFLRDRFNIFAGLVNIIRREEIYYTANGKLDYQRLSRAVGLDANT